MSTESKMRRYVAIMLASAVLWIFLGSLINFHQHRILGKQLIEESSPFIKPKDEKTLALQIQPVNAAHDHQHHSQVFLFVALILSIAGFVMAWRKIRYPSFTLALKIAEFPSFEKFRGPPMA